MALFRKSDQFKPQGSFGRWIAAPFRKLMRLMLPENQSMHRTGSQQTLHNIKSILWFPFHVFLVFLGFLFTAWASSRSGWSFFRGLPALMTATGVFLSIAVANHFYRNIVYNRYEGSANAFMEAKNPKTAILCLKRLVREQPGEPRYQFSLAMAKQSAGNIQECMDEMKLLAPLDEPGYLPAHQWLANEYLVNESDSLSKEERLNLALQHLELAFAIDSGDLRVRLQMAVVQQERGQIDEAIRNYKSVANYELPANADISDTYLLYLSQSGPPLIKLLSEQKNYKEAVRYQQSITRKLSAITNRMPDNVEAWRMIVLCHLGTNDYAAATAAIGEAMRQARSNEVRFKLQSLLSDLYIEFADEIGKQDRNNKFEMQYHAISKSVELNFRNPRAIDRLIELVLSPQTESAETEKQIQLASSASSVSPLILHVTEACRCALRGQTVDAQKNLKIADGVSPLAATIVNSITLKLFFEPNNRSEDALAILSIAGDVWPEIPNLSYTRGEIYMKMGRTEDALNSYLHALAKLDKHLPLRESLIKCYEALGQKDKADLHRSELEKLKIESGQFKGA